MSQSRTPSETPSDTSQSQTSDTSESQSPETPESQTPDTPETPETPPRHATLMDLPQELLELIMEEVVLPGWNTTRYEAVDAGLPARTAALRRVCPAFGMVAEREMVRKLWRQCPSTPRAKFMDAAALVPLLRVKAGMGPKHVMGAILYVKYAVRMCCIGLSFLKAEVDMVAIEQAAWRVLVWHKGEHKAGLDLRKARDTPADDDDEEEEDDNYNDDDDAEDDGTGTRGLALVVAAGMGHVPLVQILLDAGMPANARNRHVGHALTAAAHAGHEHVARLLVQRGAKNAASGGYAGTAAEVAAARGDLATVQAIVEAPQPSDLGLALVCALEHGHQAVAERLVAADALPYTDPNRPRNAKARLPLLLAMDRGWTTVAVRLVADPRTLVNGGVPADTPILRRGEGHQIPLLHATLLGLTDVVAALLARDVTLASQQDTSGATALHHACGRGDAALVALLLDHGDVAVDEPDHKRHTPLWWAASHGHVACTRILLDHPAVRPADSDESDGNSSMRRANSLAAAIKGRCGTPLLDALLGHPDIVGCADPVFLAESLSAAVRADDVGVAQRLLDTFQVAPDCSFRRVPAHDASVFHTAVMHGSLPMVQLLLGTGTVDVAQNYSRTPTLLLALERGHAAVALCLLDLHASRFAHKSRTLYAAIAGCCFTDGVLNRLLADPDVDPNANIAPMSTVVFCSLVLEPWEPSALVAPDYTWRLEPILRPRETPLLLAARRGLAFAVDALLALPRTRPNFSDRLHRTPLLNAVMWHRIRLPNRRLHSIMTRDVTVRNMTPADAVPVVRRLLAHPDTDVNARDTDGWSPLLAAVYREHTDLVALLMEHPRIRPNRPNHDGWTPLQLAAITGQVRVARLLLQHPKTSARLPHWHNGCAHSLMQLADVAGCAGDMAALLAEFRPRVPVPGPGVV